MATPRDGLGVGALGLALGRVFGGWVGCWVGCWVARWLGSGWSVDCLDWCWGVNESMFSWDESGNEV